MGIPLSSSASAAVIIFCILASICPIQCDTSTIRPESRIINGSIAKEGEFPHQVFVEIHVKVGDDIFQSICGASILTADYILLAGHCVTNATPATDIKIVAGKHDRRNFLPGDYLLPAEVIFHPCYNQEENLERDFFKNDIAIVKLATPLALNGRNVATIQIDKQNLAVDGTATRAIGWGRRSAVGGFSAQSLDLRKADLEVITADCKKKWLPQLEPEGQICAYNNKTFLCEGDSGGPLLCDDGTGANTSVVCGVASLSRTLDNQPMCHGPGIFTRVFHYRDWITSVLEGKRFSAEGCIGERYLPEPTTEPEAQGTSRGFPSHRPNYVFFEICLILIFLSFSGKKILLNF